MSSRLSVYVLLALGACAKPAAPADASAADGVSELASITLPADPAAKLPIDPRVRSGVLDNGLTFYVEPNRRPEARVELRLAVRAGSILEDDDQLGVAHFVEHMAFNGSEHFEGNDLIAYLESLGARFGAHLNAYTSFDETVYVLQLPTDKEETLQTGLLVLRDWAAGVSFDPDECEAEKGVVLEEWRLGEGLSRRIQDATLPLLFHGSRYAERLPIGTRESLENLDCDAAVRFYKTWYRPELMSVMAVGDFDGDAMEASIRSWFSPLENPADAPERVYYTVPDHDETLVNVVTDPELPQGGIALIDKVDEVEGDDHAAYRHFLLEQLVYMMLNERLAILGQDPMSPWLGAQASTSALGHLRATQSLSVMPKQGAELDALQAVLVEVERVHRHGFTDGELRRARDEMARNMRTYFDERDKTDSSTHIEELLRVFLTAEPMPGIPYEYAMAQAYLPSITLEEIDAYAQSSFFTGKSRVVQVLGPQSPDIVMPDADQVRAVLDRIGDLSIAAPAEEEADQPLMTELPTPGTARKVATDRKLGTTTYELSNGITVVLKPTTFQEDQIMFEAFSPGGTSVVPDEDYIPAVTAVSLMLRSGVADFTAVQLAKMLAGRQAGVTPGIGRTREYLRGGSSVEDFELMLQLLYLGVTQPRFDAQALELEQQGRLEGLRNRAVNPDAAFEDAWADLVWQGNPRQTNWTLDDLAKMDLARSEAIYRDRFSDMGDFTFVFGGNLDEATVVPLLERYLASLPATGRNETWKDDGIRRLEGVHVQEFARGQTPRARVRILFHGPFEVNWTTRGVLEATGAVLETRLLEELREARGGTYGVQVAESAAQEPTGTYALQVGFECDPERVDELVQAAWTIIDEVRATVYSEAGIATMREKNRRSRETALNTNGFWVGGIAGALARGEDPRDLLGFDARNDALSAEAVQEMAAQVLNREQYIQVIQRP